MSLCTTTRNNHEDHRMHRVLCWLFAAGLTISALGCGGNEPATMPEDTGEVATEVPVVNGKGLEVPSPGPPPP
jgi:hypothetical protein